jgi:hypothetical protein
MERAIDAAAGVSRAVFEVTSALPMDSRRSRMQI